MAHPGLRVTDPPRASAPVFSERRQWCGRCVLASGGFVASRRDTTCSVRSSLRGDGRPEITVNIPGKTTHTAPPRSPSKQEEEDPRHSGTAVLAACSIRGLTPGQGGRLAGCCRAFVPSCRVPHVSVAPGIMFSASFFSVAETSSQTTSSWMSTVGLPRVLCRQGGRWRPGEVGGPGEGILESSRKPLRGFSAGG